MVLFFIIENKSRPIINDDKTKKGRYKFRVAPNQLSFDAPPSYNILSILGIPCITPLYIITNIKIVITETDIRLI